ncbi:MAG: hypothetical protein WCJ35_13275 [Planctomycetota bacterium]
MTTTTAVRADGTVLLGESVSCDGFAFGRKVRIQTHVHHDHMTDFGTSKAEQDIIVTQETKDLLIAILNCELPRRNNIIVLPEGQVYSVDGEQIEIMDNGHMLGSAHVRVSLQNGLRVGYSSDFYWPLARVFEVDELVIDSTYGNPDAVRSYDQQKVEEQFVQLVLDRLRRGSVVVLGYRGRLQYGMSLFSGCTRYPMLATHRVGSVAAIYLKYGVSIDPWTDLGSAEANQLMRDGNRYLAFVELTEQRNFPWIRQLQKITLSAYMVPHEEPVMDYGNGDFRVALTDHADFSGTLEFVHASKARKVITHPGRGDAYALAHAIRSQLGVESIVGCEMPVRGWG